MKREMSTQLTLARGREWCGALVINGAYTSLKVFAGLKVWAQGQLLAERGAEGRTGET